MFYNNLHLDTYSSLGNADIYIYLCTVIDGIFVFIIELYIYFHSAYPFFDVNLGKQ